MLSPIFEKFVEKGPISVMARGMMERVLNPNQLDQWFNETAEQQYTKVKWTGFLRPISSFS